MRLSQLNGAWFELTPHAIQRALDMALTEDQIQGALGDPRHVRSGKGMRELWTRDKLTAVVEPREGYWSVVTFVWATANAWATDEATIRSRDGDISADSKRAFRYAAKMRKRGRSVR